LLDGKSFPLVLTPPPSSLGAGEEEATADLEGWTRTHRHELLAMAQDHGAVLLRGFDVPNPTRCVRGRKYKNT
jgi:hypothetical protein